MELGNDDIPSSAVIENADLKLSEYDNREITVGQEYNIHPPKPEEYLTISKWDMERIRSYCKSLKCQSTIVSDILLTIGPLMLGAFLSAVFSGVNSSSLVVKAIIYILFPVLGCCALVSAFLLKMNGRDKAEASAEEIEAILNHISTDDEENQI